MPRYKFNINGIQFNSKKAVIEYVRQNIHSQYPSHQPLSSTHLQFMVSLLRHHLYSDQKIGVGVHKMWLQSNEEYPTRNFWLERRDGTKTDFSFYQCVSPSSSLRDFKSACRRAIASFVIDFKQQYFQQKGAELFCPILGKEMTINSSHVDHAPPNTFDSIVSKFIEVYKIDVENAPLEEHKDGKIGNRFIDYAFKKEWVDYHNGLAELRVISAEANLGLRD